MWKTYKLEFNKLWTQVTQLVNVFDLQIITQSVPAML